MSAIRPSPSLQSPSRLLARVTCQILLVMAALTLPEHGGAQTTQGQTQAQPVEVSFFYPVAVGGPLTKLIDEFAVGFEKEHPGIRVKPVYTGTYKESTAKAITAHKSGVPPAAAVLFSADMHSLIDNDAIIPFDGLINSPEDDAWLQGFSPALMTNSIAGGRTWGIPFQRSTILLYWNKAAFKSAGLDPQHPPATRVEMAAFAQRLTRADSAGRTTQWGVQIPSSGFPYWMFQGLATGNGVELMNRAGTQTRFDDPAAIEALQFWVDLSRQQKVHAPGILEWGTTPQDFLDGKTAMAWMSSGNLANIKSRAKFDFGVATLPGSVRRGSPTGGGNFYLFKRTTPQQQRAALQFIQWVTAPARAAQWSIATGYIAVRDDAWETPVMKQYLAGFPSGAVARTQLASATAELSTHRNQRVTQALNKGLRDALTGTKSPAQALRDAQAEAAVILRPYQR
jgi:sn-glycerol 3-phosphate transport system substrate-binding protein